MYCLLDAAEGDSHFVSYQFMQYCDKLLLKGRLIFMNQKKIGSFIAALRKEKGLTQMQFAEILGINNRSISRWENGHCMPDLSLLQSIAEELEVTVPELLSGERMTENGTVRLSDSIEQIIALSDREKAIKAKKINHCFLAGLVCFLLSALHCRYHILSVNGVAGIAAGLGILFEVKGFYHNNHDKTLSRNDMEQLLKSGRKKRMKTAQEMLQFAGKHQNVDLKQYKSAFKEIEKNLETGEYVVYAAVGNSCFLNEMPMMWHVAFAVTKERFLIGGERMKGMLMVSYAVQSFPISDIISVRETREMMKSMVVISTSKDEWKIEMQNAECAKEMAEKLIKASNGEET